MGILSITKTYGLKNLTEADLDHLIDDYQTFLNVTKLNDDNIQGNTLTGAKLIDGTITANELSDNIVSTSNLIDSSITTDKLDNNAITSIKVLDSNITKDKLTAANFVEITSSTDESITSIYPTYTDTTLSVNITTLGGPILIVMTGSDVYESKVEFNPSTTYPDMDRKGNIGIFRDSTQLTSFEFGYDEYYTVNHLSDELPEPFFPLSLIYLDNPGAGTYNYKIKGAVTTASTTMTVERFSLKVIEL